MQMNVKKKRISKELMWEIAGTIACILIAFIFFCDMLYVGNIKKHGIKLNAYVENIDMDGLSGSGDDSGIYADIAYVYQGVKHQARISKGLDASTSSGKNIVVFADPDNPEHIVLESSGQTSALIMIFFGVCSVLLVNDVVKRVNKYKRKPIDSKRKLSSFIK